jgi:GNAT superfamily N-acetyltransferase
MTGISDAELYRRNIDTLLASFEAYTCGAIGAVVRRFPGVAIAVFPNEPERSVYNNAVLDRDLSAPERREALDAIASTYRDAGIEHFAVWVHESDTRMRDEIGRRDLVFDSSTLMMSMALDDAHLLRPHVDLVSLEWDEHVRLFGLPEGLLRDADHDAFHLLVASLDGEPAATALAFDHQHDCGIYNVGTLEHARRRGLGTALTALQLVNARARGCETASLQSSPMAEGVYAAVGFRDLGRILEYVPKRSTAG